MKYVYNFGDGKADGKADMKNLLGGKGANLAEMNILGIPVPPGFTLTTDVCTEYYKNNKSFPDSLTEEVKEINFDITSNSYNIISGELILNDVPITFDNKFAFILVLFLNRLEVISPKGYKSSFNANLQVFIMKFLLNLIFGTDFICLSLPFFLQIF